MVLLLARPHQRAEYRADALAARIAGADAMESALRATLLTDSCAFAADKAVRSGDAVDMWTLLRAHVVNIPQHEQERVRRITAHRGTRVDGSHPPTSLRIEMVHALPGGEPLVMVGAEESGDIATEVRAAWRPRDREKP
ncbi:MAG TPA: hypothetical protein VKC57_17855 [Ktedonobacterales bacterium]|nr:hypothetical protein [Ktedonobacterales bacterium]